jgi:hypothetical protein
VVRVDSGLEAQVLADALLLYKCVVSIAPEGRAARLVRAKVRASYLDGPHREREATVAFLETTYEQLMWRMDADD